MSKFDRVIRIAVIVVIGLFFIEKAWDGIRDGPAVEGKPISEIDLSSGPSSPQPFPSELMIDGKPIHGGTEAELANQGLKLGSIIAFGPGYLVECVDDTLYIANADKWDWDYVIEKNTYVFTYTGGE